ncbi:MAG: surface antigen protein, partial [Labilithrix sp.]|nr:surface antigen protein [Labilithrix sp.]
LGQSSECAKQPASERDKLGQLGPNNDPQGQAVAVAFTPDDRVVVFTREPAALHLRAAADLRDTTKPWQRIDLGGAPREDTGHAIFHSNTGGRIACVSCHPGGGDDGRVWQLSTGMRRTQSLQGTLEGTAPYHWNGDALGLNVIGADVFTNRMAGQHLDYGQLDALQAWLVHLPSPHVSPALDSQAALRGKALFESAAVGCSGCHSGPKLTNSETVDVGTGGAFQVPSLLDLRARPPYLHDGRAPTLHDRFGLAGGGDEHGTTSQLDEAAISDLVRYLESL